MSYEQILKWLRAEIGLEPASLGPTFVRSAVAARQAASGAVDCEQYAALLQGSMTEKESLIEDLVVPESWFFRGGALFDFAARFVRDLAQNRGAGRPVRMLCIPCSGGEEPYSLAIALAELALPANCWHLDAVDLSRRALERARLGRYGPWALRQTDARLRDKYFRAWESQWEIDAAIRSAVNFQQGNLVARSFLLRTDPYDLIFCRNLLIYCHRQAQQQALRTLERLLAPQGLIATGYAEPLCLFDPRFSSFGPEGLFLFERASGTNRRAGGISPLLSDDRNRRARGVSPLFPPPPTKTSPGDHHAAPPVRAAASSPLASPTITADSTGEVPSDGLAAARAAADAGELENAMLQCQAWLTKAGPSADAYSLLGILHAARQDRPAAQRAWEKALYLQPDHPEALLHLMWINEQNGAAARAAALRQRLHQRTAGAGP